MNTEQKAKAYDEALEKMKSWARGEHPECFTEAQKTAEFIFPELKESEDEKVEKAIFGMVYDSDNELWSSYDVSKSDVLAWLEKQGEQEKPQVYKTDDGEVITYSESEGYKVIEPKFKVGDWVVFNNKHQSIYQVEKIEDGYYILRHTHGGTFRVCVLHDESLRPWTIQDAKDGDVLAAEDKDKVFIYNGKLDLRGRVCAYCGIYKTYDGLRFTECAIGNYFTYKEPYPATKEQCDLLFQKMKEAGYEWDTEKKELRKIEDESENYNQQVMSEMTNLVKDYIRQKSTWSEEDERMLHTIIADFKGFIRDNTSTLESHFNECIDWLKSIKNKIVN